MAWTGRPARSAAQGGGPDGAPDVLTGGPDRPPRRRPRLPRPPLRVAVAGGLTLALLAGGVAGALGTGRWRDRQAEAARRAAVDLVGWVVATSSDTESRLQVTVRLANLGPLPVRLTDASLDLPGFSARLDATSRGLELRPRASLQVPLRGPVSCSEVRAAVLSTVQVTVTTADAGQHTQDVSLYDGTQVFSLLVNQCDTQPSMAPVAFAETTGPSTRVSVGGQPALRARLLLTVHGTGAYTLSAVRAWSPALRVTAEGLPVVQQGITGGGAGPVTVTWQVADCAAARGLGYARLGLQVLAAPAPSSGAPQQVDLQISAELGVELARFVADACPAPQG